MKLTLKKVIENPKRLAIPIMTNPGIELIGETIKKAVTNGKVHYEAIKAVAEKFDSAACTVIMDLTVEAEAFGAEIIFPEDEIPSVTGRLICDKQGVEDLQIPSLSAGRIPEYLLANKLAVENITDKIILSGCIGPYSLAGRLYDMSEIMMAIYLEPGTIELLLEKCTSFLIQYCRALKEIGSDGVIIAEPAAGLLRNEDCLNYSSKYVRKIVDAVQDDDFMIVLHNCGNTGQCTNAMLQSGAKALHFGNKIDMKQVLAECPEDVLVMGNIDPVSIFKQATSEAVESVTWDLLTVAKNAKNFIISSGCDIPPSVPEENIMAFFNTVEKYNNSVH